MSLGCLWHSKRVQMQPQKRQARKVKYTLPVTYTKSSDIYLPWAILPPQHMLCYYYWVFSTSQHRVVACVGAQLQQLHLAKDTSQNPNPGVAPLANTAQVCSNQGNEQAHSGLGLASELPNCCFWEVLQPSQENSLRKNRCNPPPSPPAFKTWLQSQQRANFSNEAAFDVLPSPLSVLADFLES